MSTSQKQIEIDHSIQGELYLRSGQYGMALQEFRIVSQINPMDWVAHDRAGRILEQECDFTGAISEYQKVIQIDFPIKYPAEKAGWHFRLAGTLLKAGRRAEAKAEYMNAYRVASTDTRHDKKLSKISHESARFVKSL